ncbi:retinol dehydrogenase 12-like isoform X2 [Oratosquilla oratoria]
MGMSLLLYGVAFVVLVVVKLLVLIRLYYCWGVRWSDANIRMDGKVVVITGASAGLGKETARDLARRGARVIMACRNLTKAEKVAEDIRKDTGNELVEVHLLDTSSLSSVRNFANNFVKKEKRLDVLILNAGIVGPKDLTFTEDDLELTMATNYFGHFLLTNILLGLLKRSAPSRIVIVSSDSHNLDWGFDIDDLNNRTRPFKSTWTYGYTKLCNVLFCKQLSVYLEEEEVACNALCPGLVRTEIFGKATDFFHGTLFGFISLFSAKNEKQGSQTIIHLAVGKETASLRGKFFMNCQEAEASEMACDAGLAKKLWEISEETVKLLPEEKHF